MAEVRHGLPPLLKQVQTKYQGEHMQQIVIANDIETMLMIA
jgi:hypothetical protein